MPSAQRYCEDMLYNEWAAYFYWTWGINEKGCSWISLVKHGQCFKSKVCQIFFFVTVFMSMLRSVLMLLSKFKELVMVVGVMDSKLFVFSYVFSYAMVLHSTEFLVTTYLLFAPCLKCFWIFITYIHLGRLNWYRCPSVIKVLLCQLILIRDV